jgi:PHS family inorganic phosphate transporter-like MFS transporter
VLAVDRVNFKTIQLQGFLVMSVLFLTLGCFYSSLLDSKALLLCLYALTFFFSNFGPNVSTFCLPAQLFPPDVRVQLAGVSAASGKVGATIGAALFGVIEKECGVAYVLILSGIVSLFGAAVTIRYIPSLRFSRGRS